MTDNDPIVTETPPLTLADIGQIIEGIEHFVMNGDPEVDAVWQPYVDQLQAHRLALATATELLAVVRDFVSLYAGTHDQLGTSVKEKLARAEQVLARAEGKS